MKNANVSYPLSAPDEALLDTCYLGMLHRAEVKSARLFLHLEPNCWNETRRFVTVKVRVCARLCV